MLLELRPYTREAVRSIVSDGLDITPFIWGRTLEHTELASVGPAHSIWARDEVVAAAGLAPLWDGVAEAWLMASPLRLARYAVPVIRLLIRELERYRAELVLHRVQATVLANDSVARAFIEGRSARSGERPRYFGRIFRFEGEMRGYYPSGADALRYAWVA